MKSAIFVFVCRELQGNRLSVIELLNKSIKLNKTALQKLITPTKLVIIKLKMQLPAHANSTNSPTQLPNQENQSREARSAGLLTTQTTINYGELSHTSNRSRNWNPRVK